MKKHLISLLTIFTIFSSAANAGGIAVLNIEKIVKESKAMRDIQRKVNKKQDKYQKIVTKKQKALEKEQKRIENKKSVLSDSALKKELQSFEKKVNDLKTFVDRRQNSLKKASIDGMSTVNNKIQDIISELAKEQDLDLIIPAAQALYYKDSLNISEEVLKRLDKRITKVRIKFD